MFKNILGKLDVKHVLGAILIIAAIVYIYLIKPGDVAGFGAIGGLGATLLGLGIVHDNVLKQAASALPGNPTQGQVG